MNKSYAYVDGREIICDENGMQTQSEYYDNLDKVLVQENVIEEIKKRIQELTKEREVYKQLIRFDNKINARTTIVCASVFSIVGILLAKSIGIDPNLVIISVGVSAVVGGSLINFFLKEDYKHMVKNANGINSELEYLKLQLEKEKKILISLQEEKTRNNEKKEFMSTQIDDIQQLEALKSKLKLYHDLGYNREKYYNYYKQGILEEEFLQRNYNKTDIELAKEYLEEKGPVLVKKRNNSK